MYVRTSSIIIKDTYFLKNVNQNGGCIYIEQHEKYSLLYGLIENIVALNNSANEDAGFLFLSRGIFTMNLFIKSSLFQNIFGERKYF